jgi:hypothetical protein
LSDLGLHRAGDHRPCDLHESFGLQVQVEPDLRSTGRRAEVVLAGRPGRTRYYLEAQALSGVRGGDFVVTGDGPAAGAGEVRR